MPYINAMKYIHSHQAQMVAGLVVDRIQMAASGNAKAQAALAKYGINAHVWERLLKRTSRDTVTTSMRGPTAHGTLCGQLLLR